MLTSIEIKYYESTIHNLGEIAKELKRHNDLQEEANRIMLAELNSKGIYLKGQKKPE